MPIYEYRCSACGHELEALQKLSEPPLISCPTCRKDELVKLVSAGGFQLKGSGWYATDFKGGGKPAEKKAGGDGKADAKSEATTDGKAETKAESKSDRKADSKSEAKTDTAPATPASGSGASSSCA